MTLFLVTKEDIEYGSSYIGIFSEFDKAKAQVNIKCDKFKINNQLTKHITYWLTPSTDYGINFRIEKVTLNKKED